MGVFIDVGSKFDEASARKTKEEAKRYFDNAGVDAGNSFSSGFAKAVERDDKVRSAADKVADKLESITAAEAKRATQLEKSKAITQAVEAAERKLNDARESGDTAAVTAAEEKLAALRLKQTDIDNKLIVASAAVSRAHRDRARAVNEAGNAYRQMGSDVDSVTDKLAKMGSARGALKLNLGLAALGTLPAAATGIAEVAGALQQLSGAGFAVPGIFAGIASSVGVGALGMHGMSDALEAVNKASDGTKTSVEAASKALGGLSTNQAETVKTVAGLNGTFTELSHLGGDNMFAGISTGLKTLAAADLPAVTRGVDGISRGINQNLLEGMRSLGTSSSQGILDRVLGNTAQAQSRLTAAIDPAIHAIGTLTAAGTDSLPRLANAVGNVANRFDRFISAADANGNLAKWIDEGLTGFTQLGNSVLNLGTSFTAITEAAGGGTGLLGTLESATGKMSTFLNSTQGQTQLKTYFAEGRDMLGQLKDVATSAGPVLAGVFNAGISAANLWLPVIDRVLSALDKIPGGAAAAVGAFVTWRSVTGVASLASSLNGIVNLLEVVLPGAAGKGAAGITAAFSKITLPGWMTALLGTGAAGASAVVGLLAGGSVAGAELLDQQAKNNPQQTTQYTYGPGGAPRRNSRSLTYGAPPDPNAVTTPGYAGGGGPFGGTPGWGASVDPNWSPVLRTGPAPRPGTFRRRDGSIGTLPSATDANGVPGVTPYTPPTITEGSGAPNGGAPYIDPSKYMLGDPLAGMPAPVAGADPQKVYEADSTLITATHDLEQKKLALQVLEAKGNATQQELLTARNDLQEQERRLYTAQADDFKARTNQMKQATSDLKDVFAPLDQDFGISKGLPGLVENLTKMFGNMALAGAIGSSPSLQSAAMQLTANGGVAPGLFNGRYFNADGSAMAGLTTGSSAIGQQFFSTGGIRTGQYGLPAGTNSGGYGGSGAQFPDWVMQLGAAFGVKPSTYPGHQESDRHEAGYAPNPNHENRGIDWSGPVDAMQRFADYLSTIPGALEQVIWRNPNTGQTDTIAGGQPAPAGYYDAGTLAEHENHVHTRQSSPIPLPGGMSLLGPTAMQPPTQWSADWNAIAQKESGGNWGINTGNGYQGGLQFSPSSWLAAGGGQYAPSANQASPYQQALTAEQLLALQGPGAWPNTFTPGSSGPTPTGWGAGGLPQIGGGGQGFGAGLVPGMLGQAAGPAGFNTGIQPAANPGGGGIGITPGGTLDSAIGAAASLFPGGGAAAQIGIKLANRAIQYGGQVAGIGVSGLMETLLPTGGSQLAGNSWFSKLAGGLAGARPATPNLAGQGQTKDAPQMPNQPFGQGAPGQGGTTNNVTVNNTGATEDQNGKTITDHLNTMYQPVGR
jgi:Transglycosylase-like domain